MSRRAMQIVWFKRDLRVADHAPLEQASKQGRCLCLYVYEPELVESPEFDTSHLKFINESLAELDVALQAIGGQLTYRIGPMPEVLEELHLQCGIDVIWSHQETGNRITLERNQRVRRWVKETGLEWNEIAQHGVVRGLKSRDGWAAHWNTSMSRPLAQRPSQIVAETRVETGAQATPEQLGLDLLEKTELQVGGESKAISVLKRFLHDRGRNYRNEMSSPVTAWQSCSRLSPYLTWGCISIKTVAQQLRGRQVELREQKSAGKDVGPWLGSLSAFRSRLNWHCHFIQKLEDEPSIEWQNMSRAYDGLREDEFNLEFLAAWSAGQTGYPMVDSCMRALKQHSWINFRMRAMLVSFASYHLWLDWRPTAQFLAKHFLDFEPGIHYPQIQMQSGTTGINAVRIYSPIKQVKDHDPQGVFIRRYVPELAAVPDEYLAEPHKMPLTTQRQSGCIIGKRYPHPIVEHTAAYREARARMGAIRRQVETKRQATEVYRKHGSRRRPATSRKQNRKG